jgi:hypothetical protein
MLCSPVSLNTSQPDSGQMYRPVNPYLISRLHTKPDPARSMRPCSRAGHSELFRRDHSRARRSVNGAARSIRCAPVWAVSLR